MECCGSGSAFLPNRLSSPIEIARGPATLRMTVKILETVVLYRLLLLAPIATLAAAPASAQPARAAQPAPQASAPPATAQQPQRTQDQPIPRARFLSNMDAEFRKMDADKNGILTKAEVEAFQRATSILTAQGRNRALFTRLDSDRNGQLSPAEFAKLQTDPPPPNADPMLAKFDLNKDRAISLVEYRTGTLANFDRLDADKDGQVTAVEMRAGGIGR